MRIEKPKPSLEPAEFIKIDRLEELMQRLSKKILLFQKRKID